MLTREEWLNAATRLLAEKYFTKPSQTLPAKLAVSCGIPAGSLRAIGQCWDPQVSSDGTTHIFICPSIDHPHMVLATLLHELVHAVIGVEEKHNKHFKRLARKVGLEGKLTATFVDPSSETGYYLKTISEQLGEYPHKALDKVRPKKENPERKRITLISEKDPRYTLSIKAILVEEFGPPKDPWGREMINKEEDEDADD